MTANSGKLDPELSSSSDLPKEELPPEELERNLKHFLMFMTQRTERSNNSAEYASCSYGWLPAMNYLQKYLETNRNQTLKNVRIGEPRSVDIAICLFSYPSTVHLVRYERLMRPAPICLKIFQFIFDENYASNEDFFKKVIAD
jgi:hypothetical protein